MTIPSKSDVADFWYAGAQTNSHAMSSSPSIRFSVTLPASEYRTYVRAAQILTRVMGRRAPTVDTLIQAQLVGRDATGVADHYLDSIDWPLEKGRVISLRQPRPGTPRSCLPTTAPKRTRKGEVPSAVDPSRN